MYNIALPSYNMKVINREFREELRQALDCKELPDGWATAEVVRETARKVLGVSYGQGKENKET